MRQWDDHLSGTPYSQPSPPHQRRVGMQNAIKLEIKRLSSRAFEKAKKAKDVEEQYRIRFAKRTGIASVPPSRTANNPITKHFDPSYCARHANFLAKTIWHKVLQMEYSPKPAICYHIPKPNGTKREIMAFAIPDAALANVVLRRTRDRNLKRLSPSSFAYHPNKNVFDAILALKEYNADGKLFAVQIDFEKYFDNIPTRYLKQKIEDSKQISLTPHERYIFEQFMHHQYANWEEYEANVFKRRYKGTPQGASVSLLLANLANHDLDVQLTSTAGRFVRFADDIVALCSEYSQAQQIEKCFFTHCAVSGLKVNSEKSPGIAVVSDKPQEIRTVSGFDYLGYRFATQGLTIPDKTIKRLKSRISRLVNLYLLYYLKFGFNKNRSQSQYPRYDWDLLGLIYELRRSLYGGLTENQVKKFIYDGVRPPHMRGLMGFYCLLDDVKPLKELDGWMLSIVRRALIVRSGRLAEYKASCPTPTKKQLATGTWLDHSAWRGEDLPELKMPSMVLGWRAARKYFYTCGLEKVEAPQYVTYSDMAQLFDY